MEYAIIIGTIMVVAVFGLYEVLVFGVDRLFGVFAKRRGETSQPGTAPPW